MHLHVHLHGKEPKMLRRDVVELASASLASELGPRRGELIRSTQRVMERLAVNGIQGGPVFSALAEVCVPEITQRVGIAARELQRACESKGVSYYSNLYADIQAALDELCSGIYEDVFGRFADLARAIPLPQEPIQAEYRASFAAVANAAILRGRSDLEHFAEQLATKRGVTRRQAITGAVLFIGGAAVTEAVHWIFQLLNPGPQKANFPSTPSPPHHK